MTTSPPKRNQQPTARLKNGSGGRLQLNGKELTTDFEKMTIKGQAALKEKGTFVLKYDNDRINVRDEKGNIVVSELTNFPVDKDSVVYIEGTELSSDPADQHIFLKFKPDKGVLTESLDEVRCTVIKLNLGAATEELGNVAGEELSELDEERVGAYVPFNNDQDAYAIKRGKETTITLDDNVQGAISEEDDLLYVAYEQLGPHVEGAHIKLNYSDKLIKLWGDADRTGAIASGALLNADTTDGFNVEGINLPLLFQSL